MTAGGDPLACILALAIVAAALGSLGLLLRGEPPRTWLALLALTAAGLALRLLYDGDYPRGLNEDEPKVLSAAIRALREHRLLAESNISVPVLMHALFNGQLVPWLGPGRWAIRLYSLAGGVLSIPAAFAAARALGVGSSGAFGSAALVAVLPWALFYSRVMQGAELTFQQLLLIAALARLIDPPFEKGGAGGISEQPAADQPRAAQDTQQADARGGVGKSPLAPLLRRGETAPLLRKGELGELAIASFALAWLAYGYWCTRAMFALPLLAALLARGRRRLWCVLPLLIALAAYAPYVLANRHSMFIAQGFDPARYGDGAGLAVLIGRVVESLHALIAPVAEDGWLTVRAAAMHPGLLLVLAAAGALTSWRRALFLGGGFALGLAPSALAWGAPSTHRMLMAFPFIALAAGCALDDLIPRPRLRRAAVALVAAATAAWSAQLYFSDAFWTPEARAAFDWQRTELVESLPFDPAPPVFFLRQMTQFREPRRWVAPDDRALTADVWLPGPEGGLYAFAAAAAPLRPLYEQLAGADQVHVFGDSFTARFAPGDWSRLRAYGWRYTLRCGDQERRAQVPALHQMNMGFAELACSAPVQHQWDGTWDGPPTAVVLRASGPFSVQTPRGRSEAAAGPPYELTLDVQPGDALRVAATTPAGEPWSDVALFEGERVPAWERVHP
ncbi:MAG: hypothetical protein SF182_30650 [Deltaproteobacteria bacterium]|nr:hypothetical protein [Deltaproteobacteria bacterium]